MVGKVDSLSCIFPQVHHAGYHKMNALNTAACKQIIFNLKETWSGNISGGNTTAGSPKVALL